MGRKNLRSEYFPAPYEIWNEMGESYFKIQSEGYHENPPKTEKRFDGANFSNRKCPSINKIEYNAIYSL